MKNIRTKETAEAVLRELPSVLGAHVREDVYGHPREVHLLVGPGPDVRHLARDVRELLEERLGIRVDQRVISIAQLTAAPERADGDATEARTWPQTEGAAAAPSRERERAESPALGDPAPADDAQDRRAIFAGLETLCREGRVTVRVTLRLYGREIVGEGKALDGGAGRARAAAEATLRALAALGSDPLGLELEAVSVARALDREFALVSVLVTRAGSGRRPTLLAAAHPVEGDVEEAAALATLKATDRVARPLPAERRRPD